MSTTLPSIARLDEVSQAPSNLAFRPFASLDLTGGNAVATITFATDEVQQQGALPTLIGTPAPGFTSYGYTAADVEALETLLKGLSFTWTGTPPAAGGLLFSLSLGFGPTGPIAATTEVLLTAPDAPTSITGLPTIPGFAYSGSPVLGFLGDVTVADLDAGALLTVRLGWRTAEGTMFFLPAEAPVTLGADGRSEAVLTGTPEEVTAALRGLAFVPASGIIGPGAQTEIAFTLRAEDGRGTDVAEALRTISVMGSNFIPTATGLLPDGSYTVTEIDLGLVVIPVVTVRPSVTFAEDETFLPYATVSVLDPDAEPEIPQGQMLTAIVELLAPGDDTPVLDRGTLFSSLGGSYDASVGVWSVTGHRAVVEAALRSLAFTPNMALTAPEDTALTRFALTLFDGMDAKRYDRTLAEVVGVASPITLPETLDLGRLAEGELSANFYARLLAAAQHADPTATMRVASVVVEETEGVWRLDLAGQSLRFDADGFDATDRVERIRYAVVDANGANATGWATLTITGPAMPTQRGTAGADPLAATGGGQRVLGLHGDDTIAAEGSGNRLFGGWGNDSIAATGWQNRIEGGPGDDTILAGQGDATVDLGDGNNSLTLGGWNNLVTGWHGNNLVGGSLGDTTVTLGDGFNRVTLAGTGNRVTLGDGGNVVAAGSGNARVLTGAGADTVTATGHGNTVETGGGNDSISGLFGNGTIRAGDGDDRVEFGGGWYLRVEGAAGADTLRALLDGGGGHTVDGGGGNDALLVHARSSSLRGGEGDDLIQAAGSWNLLLGDAGADTLEALAGAASTLRGGEGADLLLGTLAGGNALFGENGADTLRGGTAADTLHGGAGEDSLAGGFGADSLMGGDGADTLVGGAGADTMVGAGGNDAYYVDNAGDRVAERGTDALDVVVASVSWTLGGGLEQLLLRGTTGLTGTGNELDNLIAGTAGADRLLGRDGADTLQGGAGADTLTGGAGLDRLVGGAGADRFVFATAAEGGDAIIGFQPGEDALLVRAAGFGGGLAAGTDLAGTGRFLSGPALTQATSPAGTGQFVFDSSAGLLWWDADGAGGAASVLVASFQGQGSALTASGIIVIG
jgi:Ca2+-binding RTX toxin-like protein